MWEVMNTMTTRQAFETEAKKHGFILDRLDKSGEYVQLITEQAWNIWQAATAAALEAPAQPERKPMTDDETLALFDRVKVRMLFTDAEVAPFASGVAAAEHFHGIGDKT